jgi:surfactin synthase thioesterase subunit
MHQLDNAAFLCAVEHLNGTPKEVLRDEMFLHAFLPSLRADFELNETYVPLPGRALRCNVVAFMGATDPEVDESELIAWREVTSGEFRHHVLPGDHFYLQPCPDELLELVSRQLSVSGVLHTGERPRMTL